MELKYEKGSIDNSESNSIMYMRPSADSICKYMAEENTDRTKYDYLVNGKYNFYFPSGMQIDLGYTYRQANITENRLRLRDFVDDNSYHSSAMTRQNIPFISLAYQRRKLNVTIGIELPLVSENMSYHKSLVDTIVHRTYTDFSPNLTIGWGNRRHYLRVNSKFGTTRRPSINDLVNTTDDSNPLMILKGNGGLKKESSFDIDINLSITNPNRDFTSSLQSSVRMLFNNITQSEYYNSESGAYTFMPVNVNGTLITTNKFSIGTAFDKKRLFRWQNDLLFTHSHFTQMTGVDNSTLIESATNSNSVEEKMSIKYQKGNVTVNAFGSFSYQGSRNNANSQYDYDAIDFSYGLSGLCILPWNIQLAAEMTMYTRSGYEMSELNKNSLVSNISLSKSLFQGKIVATLKAYDIFHQLTNIERSINANSIEETSYNCIPRYIMMSLSYRFGKKKR